MTGRWAVFIGGLATLLAAACSSGNDGGECDRFCVMAATCGMLPSPLGLDRSDCVARCKLSDTDSFQNLTGCFRHAAPSGASPEDLWCGSADFAPDCEVFDACLQTTYPGADVTGTTSLTVGFLATPPADPALAMRAPDDEACEPSLDPTVLASSAAAGVSCQLLDIHELRVGVAARSMTFLPPMACSAVTLETLVIPGLSPGAVRPVIDVTAAPTPGGSVECRRFYGPRVVAAANVLGAASVLAVPASTDVFLAGAPCTNLDGGSADATLSITSPDAASPPSSPDAGM